MNSNHGPTSSSADVISFVPRSDLDARTNLDAFVTMCRDRLTALGADLPFENDTWDVTETANRRAHNARETISFTTLPIGRHRDTDAAPMLEPFKSFAKAYVRYMQGLRPIKSLPQRMTALRALDRVLVQRGDPSDASLLTRDTFNAAAAVLAERCGRSAAYSRGQQLELLAHFLDKHRLVAVPLRWKNPVRRPQNRGRVGPEFDEVRRKKLPSPAALNAIAKIFRMAEAPSDVIVSGVCAILCSAPSRINEVCHLEAHCEVRETIPTTGELVYGMRWRPSKGGESLVKWCTASMTTVVQEALEKIRRVTQPARDVARWYEQNPKRLYLPIDLEHLRSQERLTLEEVDSIVFAEPAESLQKARNSAVNWCETWKVPVHRHGGKGSKGPATVAFDDVERVVVGALPRGFPYANRETSLKFSEALLVARRHELGQRRPMSCIIELVDVSAIRLRLAGAITQPNIFQKFGFAEDDGSLMRITTHQFRHYLNTIAQAGGLDELDIAKWSGRVNVTQNAVYNHVSDRDVLALVREAIGDDTKMFGPLAKMPAKALIPRDEFSRLKVQTAHTTEFGYCIHDFTMLPCQVHRDCMNCDEQVCIKGDRPKESAIRHCRDTTRELLAEAISNDRDGAFGASRWVEHQSRTLARLDQLCEILDNPRVPDGAVIQPAGIVPASRIEQATARRQKLIAIGKASAERLTGRSDLRLTHQQLGEDQ